mmetsp:Transcript_1857/g.4857  ORF Transcript_1857/g.4857 Transcript_1857/m.4857 type:complete len:628 (-) Transcript_1857:125-2008(-)
MATTVGQATPVVRPARHAAVAPCFRPGPSPQLRKAGLPRYTDISCSRFISPSQARRPGSGGSKAASASKGKDEIPALEQEETPQEVEFTPSTPPVSAERAAAQQAAAEAARKGSLGRARHQPGDLLGPKQYRVEGVIGAGSNAVTYKATTQDGVAVAVKTLSLKGMSDWKQLQLFEREASTLRALSHPGIPQYLDYFEEDSDIDRRFYLVQELAAGTSLAEMAKAGHLFTEEEITGIAAKLLEILTYLGNLRPPVVHRDVKPENILLDGETVRLVDFGGVQEATIWGDGMPLGSTVVGTYGYMAPEQFRGAAQPASDLYALGGTLLHLLSGHPPSSFPQTRLKIDFSQHVTVGPQLAQLLNGLLEPVPEDRLTAKAAMSALAGHRPKRQVKRKWLSLLDGVPRRLLPTLEPVGRPMGARATVFRRGTTWTGMTTVIEVPPSELAAETAAGSTLAVTWNLWVGYWTLRAVTQGGILYAAFSVPFWVVGVMLFRSSVGRFLARSRLEIGPERWRIVKEMAVLRRGRLSWDDCVTEEVGGSTRDLSMAKVVAGSVEGQAHVNILERSKVLIRGAHVAYQEGKPHRFAAELGGDETSWIASVINNAIVEHAQEDEGTGSMWDGDNYVSYID